MTDEQEVPTEKLPTSPASQNLETLDEVRFAIAQNDWERLRKISTLPGGFGEEGRKEAWVYLLHAHGSPVASSSTSLTSSQISDSSAPLDPTPADNSTSSENPLEDSQLHEVDSSEPPHPDERQVGLDTDRSFVIYPIESPSQKALRKTQLQNLIVSVLRKRRKLSYFQGYHDVISVLYLTLQDSPVVGSKPSPLLVSCAEKISLHRLRDAMGVGLEPLVGCLRILKRIFKAADPEMAAFMEQASPLPYFALSNILTLFSHDAPTLPLIQRIFDYLLCRPPIVVIYLAAVVVLCRKDDTRKLQAEGEEGMMHSILSQLPDMYPDGSEEERQPRSPIINQSTSRMTSQSRSQSRSHSRNSARVVIKGPGVVERDDDVKPEAQPSLSRSSSSHSNSSEKAQNPSSEKHKNRIPISKLLQDADELYAKYPPTHEAIRVGEIMGPNSVMFTWSELDYEPESSDPEKRSAVERRLPSDDVAESMVEDRSLIVQPYDPSEDEPQEDEEKPLSRRPQRGLSPKNFLILDKTTLLTGMVVVIGIGIAVYAVQTDRRAREHQWKKFIAWFGSMVIGFSVVDEWGNMDDEL